MATHDKDIVNRMKKRVLVINHGVLVGDYAKGSYKTNESVQNIFRSIRDALKSVVRNFSLSFASIMCTTITLILVAVAVVAAANVNNATKLIEDELTIVTYLKKM